MVVEAKDIRGYFFVDPRTCEEILYVPHVMEVRCVETPEGYNHTVNLDVNSLEAYAVKASRAVEGVEWGVKTKHITTVDIERGNIDRLCELCRGVTRKAGQEARQLATDIFDLTAYRIREQREELGGD